MNIHEAKTHFSKLIERVLRGDEVIIAKAGRPVARLVPVDSRPASRLPGSARGEVTISADFDAPLPKPVQKNFE